MVNAECIPVIRHRPNDEVLSTFIQSALFVVGKGVFNRGFPVQSLRASNVINHWLLSGKHESQSYMSGDESSDASIYRGKIGRLGTIHYFYGGNCVYFSGWSFPNICVVQWERYRSAYACGNNLIWKLISSKFHFYPWALLPSHVGKLISERACLQSAYETKHNGEGCYQPISSSSVSLEPRLKAHYPAWMFIALGLLLAFIGHFCILGLGGFFLFEEGNVRLCILSVTGGVMMWVVALFLAHKAASL